MGPPEKTMMMSSVVLMLVASVALAQHEGFNVAPPAIHSGVVQFRRDQYRYLRQAYDPGQQQQFPQPPQQSYQVSGSVGPQQLQQQQYGGSYAQVTQQLPAAPVELQMQQQQQVFAAQPLPNPAYESVRPPSFGPLGTPRPLQQPAAAPAAAALRDGSASDPAYAAASTNLQLARWLKQLQQQVQPNQYAQQQPVQQLQPPPAPLSPFLPQQQQQHLGSYAQFGQLQQPQQQYQGGFYPQQQPQQQQYAAPVQQQQKFYQQRPPVSPAAQNPFYAQPQQQLQQLQQSYVQQQPQQLPQYQPLPVVQQPQFQQQQYPQQPQLQQLQQPHQQAYAQQPQQQYQAQPQFAAPPQQQLQQRPAAVIAPPPLVQQLPATVARPAPPPQQLLRVQPLPQSATARPPPARFTPYVADVRDPAAAVAATASPRLAPAPFETVTIVTVDTHTEQVADVAHTRAEARVKALRHKKKKRVKVLPTTVETVSVAAPPPRPIQRVVTTTFPPSIAPPTASARLQQQQRVRPSTLAPAPPPQVVTKPAHVHKPTARPSKLVELTTAAAASAEGRDPNEVFLQCCRDTGIDAKCHSRCNFDTLTKKVLTGMFLGTDPCPQKNGRNMLGCAAENRDHTQCCLERGVHTTAAKNKCLGFCVMTPGSTFQADISMLPCWAVLNDIKGCFKDAILDE